MPANSTCPLCGRPPKRLVPDSLRAVINVECNVCGRFNISEGAEEGLRLKPDLKFRLSSVTRKSTGAGQAEAVEITSENIGRLVNSLPRYGPVEKLDVALRTVAEMTDYLGGTSRFSLMHDYPLLAFASYKETQFVLETLVGRHYLEMRGVALSLSMTGWERFEQMRRIGPTSSTCFVAMSFDPSMDTTYDEAIRPAIIQAGYDALRIDRVDHVNRIDDEIVGQIKRSRFMVADFTGQRHGVYFEAGMMLGLGRTVVWMCRRNEVTNDGGLHFDVRQFNFIDYETEEEAKRRLYQRILAIEGEGPVQR